MYIASMTKSPWAKFTTFIMPQISVRPEENRAYTAPISRPETMTWRRITRRGSHSYAQPLKGSSSFPVALAAGQIGT